MHYEINHTIKPAKVKDALQTALPTLNASIEERNKSGFTISLKDGDDKYTVRFTKVPIGYSVTNRAPTIWAENEWDYEDEDKAQTRIINHINQAVASLFKA
jgi:hypothetical protein